MHPGKREAPYDAFSNLAKLLCKILDFLQSYFARFATNDMRLPTLAR